MCGYFIRKGDPELAPASYSSIRRDRRSPPRSLPRRRDLLGGGLALAAWRAAPARGQPQPPPAARPCGPIDVDVHCHTFCAADLPIVGFVAHYIPGLSDLTRELTRWPEAVVRAIVKAVATLPNAAAPAGAAELAALRAALQPTTGRSAIIGGVPAIPAPLVDDLVAELARLLPFSLGAEARQMLARYLDTVYLVSHARAGLAATLAESYRSVALFTPCLVDYDAWSEDRAPTPLATQIQIQSLVARLSMQGRIGRPDARFHPFVAFDPRRDAEGTLATPAARAAAPPATITPSSGGFEMVRHAVETAGFLGVKLYPAVGFAPLGNVHWRPRSALAPRIDAALRMLYDYCQAEEVPLTAHTSAENEFGLGLRQLVAPERWRPVLEAYPGLRINFGHFGHDYGAGGREGVRASEAWIRQAAALMQAYPNVYADLSNSPLVYDAGYAARFLGYLRDIAASFPKVRRRLMYGSDWWLNRLEPGSPGYLESMRKALAERFSPDEVADIMGRNALRFLGFLDEDNRPRPGPGARRLRKFYGTAAVPPWLA